MNEVLTTVENLPITWETVLVGLGIIEAVIRLIPTKKESSLLKRIGRFLDKVLPDRVKKEVEN
ncbi:hypothetical protein QWY31_00510 [Cytophagales bacterium LB-30]|uniref:Uncharacterized protein n=1 Tax=Shiella aurantiaca TaxID=3058365 RepID=A0ABT8F0I8_9BACT|nr:hypothetical protein [Shiella aurantiaca]MDN4163957.1 hypothetical protein [Shiella aurantiaca]